MCGSLWLRLLWAGAVSRSGSEITGRGNGCACPAPGCGHGCAVGLWAAVCASGCGWGLRPALWLIIAWGRAAPVPVAVWLLYAEITGTAPGRVAVAVPLRVFRCPGTPGDRAAGRFKVTGREGAKP